MKKLIALLICSAMLLSFSACSKSSEPAQTTEAVSEAQSENEKTVISLPEQNLETP